MWTKNSKGPCYAGHLHETRLAKSLPSLYAADFTEVRLAPGRAEKAAAWSDLTGKDRPDKPWLNGLPRVIFLEDMGDLFSKDVPFEYLRDDVFAAVASPKGQRHLWLSLTKQPSRMYAFSAWLGEQGLNWPWNAWAGTSVTTPKTLTRVAWLKKVPAPVRFLSLEPQWEDVDLQDALSSREVHLVIQGGESDQGEYRAHTFDLAWARKARRQCERVGTCYFLKQCGSAASDPPNGLAGRSLRAHPDAAALVSRRLTDHHGGDWSEFPDDLKVRQFPTPV